MTIAPHRYIPVCDISQGWWDLYYSFMTCCRGSSGISYWERTDSPLRWARRQP
jgi:hypothetical protein